MCVLVVSENKNIYDNKCRSHSLHLQQDEWFIDKFGDALHFTLHKIDVDRMRQIQIQSLILHKK